MTDQTFPSLKLLFEKSVQNQFEKLSQFSVSIADHIWFQGIHRIVSYIINEFRFESLYF